MNKQAGHRSEASSLLHGTMPTNTISLSTSPLLSLPVQVSLLLATADREPFTAWTTHTVDDEQRSACETVTDRKRGRGLPERERMGQETPGNFSAAGEEGRWGGWRKEGKEGLEHWKRGVCMNKHFDSKSKNWRGRNHSSFEKWVKKGWYFQMLSRSTFSWGLRD